MIDHSKDNYYEVMLAPDGMLCFHIYHYDESGNKVVTIHKSQAIYTSHYTAYDGAAEWLEDNSIDAEMS